MASKESIVPAERVERSILLIRGHKVMLDADLAVLYGVTTFNLNKAVRRNIDRFPADFMFQLTAEGASALTFQIGMSKPKFRVVFDAIRQLMTPSEPNKRKIGFIVKERAAKYGRLEINARR